MEEDGALMQSISVHHPEIRTFIHIKKDKTKVTGANISIRISDEFMQAVKHGTEYEQRWPVDSKSPTIKQMVDARTIWNEIVEAATECAEPGLMFWDTIIRNSPADSYFTKGFTTESSNPCSELPLSKDDACRLLIANVMAFVEFPFTKKAQFNWKEFERVSMIGQRLMDDIVDLEMEAIDKIISKVLSDPEDQETKRTELRLWTNIKQKCFEGRRTGLGLTAVGDMIASLGMTYGSDDSIRFVEAVYRTLCLASYQSSIQLAKERGPFPIFDYETEKDNEFLKRIWAAKPSLYEDYRKYGRRNIANLTTAPAGSVSILTQLIPGKHQTTSGIECVYLPVYTRRKKINPNDKEARVDFVDDLGDKWQEFKVYHPGFSLWKEITGKQDSDIEQSPYHKATAMDLEWVKGVELQAAAQKWIDHAISRTQNLPSGTKADVVSEVYMKAWESGCKGFTVYVDGSRSGVLVSSNEPSTQKTMSFEEHHAPKRPKELECDVYHSTVQGEKWTIFVGKMEDKPYEIMGGLSKYVNIPKRVKTGKVVKHNGEINPAKYNFHFDYDKGDDDEIVLKDIGNIFENPIHTAFTRTLSLSLRHGVPVQYVCEQLLKGAEKESDLFSFAKVMSRVLKNYIKDGKINTSKKCPQCSGTDFAYQEGCLRCLNPTCGYSKCG